MRHVCGDCGNHYDDAEQSTLCPHDRFLSPTLQAQKDLAISLLGKTIVFNHEDATAKPMQVHSIGFDGMVTISGYSGEFAPHLFRVVAPQLALCRCPPDVCYLHPGLKTCGMRGEA